MGASKQAVVEADAVWSVDGVGRDLLGASLPQLLDLSDHRAAQKLRFGGEFFPDIVEGASGKRFAAFFQTDRDGTAWIALMSAEHAPTRVAR